MNFKMSSSRKGERERPLGGVTRQTKGKALGYLSKVSLGYEEDSKYSLKTTQKCYSTSCRLGKAWPNHRTSATT
jgi:hypothetical protein